MNFDKFYVSLLNNLATVFSELYKTPQFLLQICNLPKLSFVYMSTVSEVPSCLVITSNNKFVIEVCMSLEQKHVSLEMIL